MTALYESPSPFGDLPAFKSIKADLAAMARLTKVPFPSLHGYAHVLMIPGTWSMILFRVGQRFHKMGLRPLSRIIYFLNCVLFGAEIQMGAHIAPGVVIAHPVYIGIGHGAIIHSGVTMTGGNRVGTGGKKGKKGCPEVMEGAWLLDGAKVFGPLTIGEHALAVANALVLEDVPPKAIVGGQPARLLGYRDDVDAIPSEYEDASPAEPDAGTDQSA